MTEIKISKKAIKIFEKSVNDYHVYDDITRNPNNPFEKKSFEHLLYEKNWIDTVQWHYEDIIRDPDIDPSEGMKLKRLIDSCLLYTSPSPRDGLLSRMPSSA